MILTSLAIAWTRMAISLWPADAELLRGRLQVGCDPFLFEALLRCAGPGGSGADGGFLHRFHGGDNFLGAVSQAVDPPHTGFVLAGVVFVESGVNPLNHRCQRNPALAPGLDQRPIDAGKQKQRTTAALKVFFNLSKVVEVILHEDASGVLSGCFAVAVFYLGHAVAFVDQAQAVEREHVIDSLDKS